ncbi:unnamed protein product [Schistosoma turkestanicum]|nr:unnamed protein product [Schistosoma turkestanicum]
MQKSSQNTGEQQSSAEFFSHDGIFSLETAKWFRIVNSLTNLQVCNNYLVGATSKNTLIRTPTIPPYNITEIEISRLSDDRVHNIFLDPMGWHTVISMQSGINFYVNKGMKKVRPLNKTKDHLFDSIAWNQHNVNEFCTQEILIGTNDGLIFETMLIFNEDSFFSSSNIEQYWIQIMNLGHSVTGIEIIRFPIGSPNVLVGEPQRCVILATTPCRMYQFAGWINTNNATTNSSINTITTTITATSSILSHFTSTTGISGGTSGTSGSGTSSHKSSLVNDYQPSQAQPQAQQQQQQSSIGTQNTTLFPNLTGLFYSVFNSDDKQLPVGSKVTEFPGSFGYSDLKLYRNVKDELPSKFAWMTGPGIYFGYIRTEQLSMPPFTKLSTNYDHQQSIDMKSFSNDITSISTPTSMPDNHHTNRHYTNQPKDIFSGRGVNLTRHTKLIPYPIIQILERPGMPLSICLTEFHLIIIYVDRIKAVNVLDGRVVYSMPLNNIIGYERALGMSRDPLSNQIWIFSNNHLAQLNMSNELCRIWQIYMDRLQFNEARQFCQDPSQLDTISIREAEYNFDNGNYINAAKLFARSSLPFEQIALRFCRLSSLSSSSTTTTGPTIDFASNFIQQGYEINDDYDIMEALINQSKQSSHMKPQQHNLSSFLSTTKTKTNLTESSFYNDITTSITPLKIFLTYKLNYLLEQKKTTASLNTNEHQKPFAGHIILLAIWLIELLLTELGGIRDRLIMKTRKQVSGRDDGDADDNVDDDGGSMVGEFVMVADCDNATSTAAAAAAAAADSDDDVKKTLKNRLAVVRREFRAIITLPEVLNFLPESKSLIYDLLDSHGETDEFIYFMELMHDYSRLMSYYIRQSMYSDALKIVVMHTTPDCLQQFYANASCLASQCPEEFLNVCLRLNNKLDSNRLLPSIMLLSRKQAIRYLEDSIEKSIPNPAENYSPNQIALHHMLISLYAHEYHLNPSDENDHRFMNYLDKVSLQAINMRRFKHQQNFQHRRQQTIHDDLIVNEDDDDDVGDHFAHDYQALNIDLSELSLVKSKNDDDDVSSTRNLLNTSNSFNDQSTEQNIQLLLPYDPGYVLRLCKEIGHLKGMIYILQLLDMHQEALQLAIERNNIPLAKEIAQSDYLNSNLRRQLWIQLAQHIISTDGNMQEAINLLRECPLLKLEDILPYFHQFVTIDQFKDVICSSLDSYNERIDNVKNEIQRTMKTIDELRTQSNNLRYRFEIIENDSRCIHCNHLLILRTFYVFPCGHNFHINCLIELVKPYLSTEEKLQLSKVVESQNLGKNASVTNLEDIFDEIIANDCILCGHIAIENVSKLYYENQANYESELSIWQ